MKNIKLDMKMMARSFFLLNCLLLFFSGFQYLSAQNNSRVVSGQVKDENGKGLSSVTVSVKGGSASTMSDADGKFRINVADGSSVLVFSYVGLQTQEIDAGSRNSLDITLTSSDNRLGEVVVIGYGAQRKVSLTGAVGTIKGEELTRRPVTNLQQALQGQLPGLTVQDMGGAPGNANTPIRVRGITTIGANNNNPLIIVDGIEQPMSDLNPNDIESISVLKDASSTAIYGSRAANGVILITTKRGKSGKVSVGYNGFYALQKAISKPEHMDLESYLRLQNENRINVGSAPKYTEHQIQDYVNTTDRYLNPLPFDWYNVMYHTAPQVNNAITVSGGKEDIKTLLSVRHQYQDGIIANTNAKLIDIRLNTDIKVSEKIKVAADLNYRNKKTVEPANITNIFLRMMQNSIFTVPQFPDGTYGIGPQGNNPLLFSEQDGNLNTNIDYFTGNGKAEWEIIKGLKFTTQLGARISYTNGKVFTNAYEIRDYYNPSIIKRSVPLNTLTETRNTLNEYTFNNLLNYSTVLGDDHSINALLGYSQISNKVTTLRAYRQGFYNNDIQSIGQGANDATKDNSGSEAEWGLRSYFGRLNYAFRNKYLFEANGRYDGSSRFLDENRYSFFPSFSAGWRLSQENFWGGLGKYVNEFKLRGSWGKTGNQSVDLYSYFSTLNLVNYTFNGVPVQGYVQQKLSNEDITWETTTQTDVGFDAQFLDSRLSLSVDYYYKKTDGILLVLPVPRTLGLQPAPQNAGRLDNKGWEFLLGTHNRFGQVGFDASVNFSINNNKVVDLAGTGPYITGDDIDPRYITGEGYPINSFWGYETDGLFQTDAEIQAYPMFMRAAKPGDVKVIDRNKDGRINADDMTYIGNPFPKYTYGGDFNVTYKGFGLNILLQGAADAGVRLARALAEMGNYEGFTPKIYTNNYWTPTRTNARFPRPTKQDLRNQASTDRMVIDGSYLRLKNVQLSYQVPSTITQKIFINQLRVYVSATNVLTISKLNEWNLDPESLSGWQDYYPQTGLFTFGLNVQF
jgi:TonB-linked SusC/RagA family outer membrane protein